MKNTLKSVQSWMSNATLEDMATFVERVHVMFREERDRRLQALLDRAGERPLPGETLEQAVHRLASLPPEELAQRCAANALTDIPDARNVPTKAPSGPLH